MSGQPENEGSGPRLTTAFWVFGFIGLIWMVVMIFVAGRLDGALALKVAGLTVAYLVSAPIVWLVADWIRLYTMPNAFLSRGLQDTLQKKIFWRIGPQFNGLLFLVIVLSVIGVKLAPEGGLKAKSTVQRTPTTAIPSREPAIQPTITIPARAVVDSTHPMAAPSIAEVQDSRAADLVLCSDDAVLKQLKTTLLEGLMSVARLKSGHEPTPALLEQRVTINITKITPARTGNADQVCNCNLSVQVNGLAEYRLASFTEPTSYFVHRADHGQLEADFAD